MRFVRNLVLVTALCASPTWAYEPAVPTTTAQAVDPAAVEEAIRMLDAGEFEAQVLTSTGVVVEGMMAVAIEQQQKNASNPLPEELLASLRTTLLEHASATMKSKMPHMKRQAAEIYAREFTVAELRRMREIETDPVMMKARSKSEKLSAQLMMVGMNAMREAEGDLQAKIEKLVHDYLKSAGLLTEEKS